MTCCRLTRAGGFRLRERYDSAPKAGAEDLRSRWVTCAADWFVLTRILARCVGSSRCCSSNVLAFHPRSNVRRTMPKHDSPGGFAVAQKADGLTIREEQIRKVEHDSFAVG